MAKVGRNDPCPCGSGKKYKHCHLKLEREAHSEAFLLERAQATLYDRIVDFSRDRQDIVDFTSAFDLYWNGRYSVEEPEALSRVQIARFLDWYLFDYQTSQDKKRIIELFAETQGDTLPPLERELLTEWQTGTRFGLYEVASLNGTVHLRDLLRGDEAQARQVLGIPLGEGDVLLARLLPVRGTYHFSRGGLIIPPEFKAELQSYAQEHFQAYQDRHYEATWADFLRDRGYLFNHFVLDKVEPPTVLVPRKAPEEVTAHDIVRQMQAQVIVGTLEQHYERWLDTPIRAWGNRTPRQLVRTPEGQRRVAMLLDELEAVEETKQRLGQPYYDVDLLRARLGLIEMQEAEARELFLRP
ncbi:MAG: SEC-C metal-binding domain-containing protein [Anaerolineae bacterium]